MIRGKIKRFYETAAAEPCDPLRDGFGVVLDGRAIRTPAKARLIVPTRALAEALAAEWAEQGAEVDPRAMPLTRLACTAIDWVGANRRQVVADVAAYGGHDLLCYRAEAPAGLATRQQAVWQPLLDWAARRFDAPLAVTAGIVSVPQPPEALAALRRAVEGLSDMELVALNAAVTAAGSLVIGLALAAGRIGPDEAFAAAQLDETYQIARWGEDPETSR
ncbi:MAG: ATP12 family chaperone protein, partial [Kiloniellaceae bacterium]